MLDILTTTIVLEAIEPQLPCWEKLGYRLQVRVPETGAIGFALLTGAAGELMLQTRASLAEDLPEIAQRAPAVLMYADVKSLAKAKQALPQAKVIVAKRKTFYGATESWLELPGGTFLGLAEH